MYKTITKAILKKYDIHNDNIKIFNSIDYLKPKNSIFFNKKVLHDTLIKIMTNSPDDLAPYLELAQKTILRQNKNDFNNTSNKIVEIFFKQELTSIYYSYDNIPEVNNYWNELALKPKNRVVQITLEYTKGAVDKLLKIKDLTYEDIIVNLLQMPHGIPLYGQEIPSNINDILKSNKEVDYDILSDKINPLQAHPYILGYFVDKSMNTDTQFDILKMNIHADKLKESNTIPFNEDFKGSSVSMGHYFEFINTAVYIIEHIKNHERIIKNSANKSKEIFDTKLQKYNSPLELIESISKNNQYIFPHIKDLIRTRKPQQMVISEQVQFWTNLELALELKEKNTKDVKLKI